VKTVPVGGKYPFIKCKPALVGEANSVVNLLSENTVSWYNQWKPILRGKTDSVTNW
jgi:hypothetical protein